MAERFPPVLRRLALALAALALAGRAQAADLTVTVVTPSGKPVADAVVIVHPRGQGGGEPFRFPWPMTMEQRKMQFQPFVLIVPVGAEVTFPNRDSFRHHVYSFSPAKVFELKLYGRDESRAVRFDKPGVVALGCNIHDNMSAFIRVVDTPFAGKTGPRGEVTLHNLPPGAASLSVWHPYLKGGRDITREVAAPAAGAAALSVTADLRPPPVAGAGY